ncbi:FAD/NAD(P)-binding protein [Dactylosporangium vinaceum]|uniref:FAD/NAD(P)-binding protein n=1 Tax=Dactylosporangium vinaceum TaxID=53362 RepID=A0ABV5M302_9ACTN|nr:FAD/NAD(P)-binding protein [Dactylosporangium vinaceum]UAB99855.1 FAD/NAD(P)-binding protein [Dactylosporangium vinaceum]
MSEVDVAIVGGGAAGALTLAHLAHLAGGRLRIALIDHGPGDFGSGTAYRTNDRAHLLNVRAAAMSAWPDRPGHFTDWLTAHGHDQVTGEDFVPRAAFGAYLAALTREAAGADRPGGDVRLIQGRANGVHRGPGGWTITLEGTAPVHAAEVVLAIGIEPPAQAWVPRRLRGRPRFVADPWRPGALDGVGPDDPVLIVGTGLTAVDVAVTLSARTRRPITATSRNGLLPAAHTREVRAPMPLDGAAVPAGIRALRHLVHDRVRASIAATGDWRPAIDGLRPHTQAIWAALPEADRREFLRRDLRRWDNARHRMAPAVAATITGLRSEGRLVIAAEHPSVAIAIAEPGSWIVNTTGPDPDLAGSTNPIIQQLFAAGLVTAGPLGMGWATTGDGQLRDAYGEPVPGLWTLGSTRRGQLLETTAVPEIRAQAAALAARLAGRPAAAGGARSPRVRRDQYGLPVLASARAAEHFDDAVRRVLRVQQGAGAALDAATGEDPSFALAHAVRALLAVEGVIDGDAPAALADAERAARARTDARTGSLLRAVAARVRANDPAGLLRHIDDFPRDALVVNACVPTIAFGGATQVPQHAWAVVERLAPVYGEDWWYLGLLAFVRQEQHRWPQSAELAERSLAADPAGGHAAHARSHVYYETGEHRAGLAWLDGWIDGPGAAAFQGAHFSWHAALHELALERWTDVSARLRGPLSPRSVGGVRALVDSASLLWRCRVLGAPPQPLAIDEVLGVVPKELLAEPQTAFIGLHAALALAAADDLGGLDALARHAATRTEPAFDLVAALVRALRAYLAGDYDRTVELISRRTGEWVRLGGSDAQREVIDDTLLSALQRSQRSRIG